MRHLKLTLTLAPALTLLACSNAPESNRTANTNIVTANVAASRPAATPASQAPGPDEFAATRAVYAQHCQRCHQPEGAGGVFEEQGLKPLKVPSLRTGSVVRHTDEQLTRKITNGDDGMPAFKNKLSPEQITQLVAFIRQEFQGRSAPDAANAPRPVSAH